MGVGLRNGFTLEHISKIKRIFKAMTKINPERYGQLVRLASVASVCVAILLILAKAYAWGLSSSTAILSSLVDSLMDASAALVNFWAVQQALTPPDREHRFGHGKAEALAGLAQAAFIAGSAAFLILEATSKLSNPHPIDNSDLGMIVMVLSIALTFALVIFQKFVIHQTQSFAVSTDSLHYVGDILSNGAVILALILADKLNFPIADPIFAIGIAFYIMWSAWIIFREAFDHLMDRELPDNIRAEIQRIVLTHPEVKSLHDLRTRSSGATSFIQLHLVMDPDISLKDAHRIADEVEQRVIAAFPGVEVIVHQDPAGLENYPSHPA